MPAEIEPETAVNPSLDSSESSRNLLFDALAAERTPDWGAKEIASHLNGKSGRMSDLQVGMDVLSQKLQNLAGGDFKEYTRLLREVHDHLVDPESKYRLTWDQYNPETGTVSNVMLRRFEGDRPIYRIVQPGDTFSQIAYDHSPNGVLLKTPWEDQLARHNHIKDQNKIFTGQAISLDFPLEYMDIN